MPSSAAIRVTVGLTVAVLLLVALITGEPVEETWPRSLGIAATLVTLVFWSFDRVLWRWLPSGITRRPKLYGTWKATLTWEWPAGTEQEKDCYLAIRQTFSRIAVDMCFDISSSECRSAGIVNSGGRRLLCFSYWSAARALRREDNAPHRGAAELVIATKPKASLRGDYWTDRRTLGHIETHGRSKKLYDDFSSAASGTYT